MLGVFRDQEVDHLRYKSYSSCLIAVLHQLSPFHGTFFCDGQRPAFDIKVAPFQGD